MDNVIFQSSTFQNALSEFSRLAITANEKSTARELCQTSSNNNFFKPFSGFLGTTWILPLQWSRFPNDLKDLTSFILEYWDEIPEADRNELVKLSKAILNFSSATRIKPKRGLLEFLKTKTLVASLHFASFVLKRDISSEIVEAGNECVRDVLEKAGIIPGWNSTRTLVLSNKARDAFLRDVENPPEPPEALVSGMKEFWEQFS